MLISTIKKLHEELTHQEFSMLLDIVDDDIKFGKHLGVKYDDTKILGVINNSVPVVRRLDMKKLKKLTREQKRFLTMEGLDPKEFLVERVTAEGYVFYNINTKVLWSFRR